MPNTITTTQPDFTPQARLLIVCTGSHWHSLLRAVWQIQVTLCMRDCMFYRIPQQQDAVGQQANALPFLSRSIGAANLGLIPNKVPAGHPAAAGQTALPLPVATSPARPPANRIDLQALLQQQRQQVSLYMEHLYLVRLFPGKNP